MAATLDPAAFFARYVTGDQAVLADPYPFYRALRERTPVLRVEDGSGGPWDAAWHVLDHATVSTLLTDKRMSSRRDLGGRDHGGANSERDGQAAGRTPTGSSDPPPGPPGGRPPIPPMMLTMDPPDHTRLRRLAAAAFTPRAVEGLRADVRALVDGLLDEADATAIGGTFDLVRAFAYPLPTVVIARLLGLPDDDWPAIKRWSEPGISFAQDERSLPNAIALGGYLAEAVARRRREPADDLIGALVAARDGGDVLSDAELVGQCQLLLVAGHETTSYALATAVLNLLRTPGAWEGLPGQDMERAVDELLRFDAPFQAMNRVAAADVDLELGARVVRAGEFVWLWVGAANRDPARFPDPDRLDLNRADNRHLSFGLGIHFCLGAALARLEMAVALTRLRARFPRLRLADEAVVWRDPAIRGPKSLPVSCQ